MSRYGDVAVRAIELVVQEKCGSPVIAWRTAAEELLSSPSMQIKGCPKNAFLGLCEAGLVKGIPAGEYGNPRQNGKYALQAVEILEMSPHLNKDKAALWNTVTGGGKAHNSQMDVVVRLWSEGLLGRKK